MRGSERWSFLDFLLAAGVSYASVDEFSVELTYAVAAVFVFQSSASVTPLLSGCPLEPNIAKLREAMSESHMGHLS